MSQVQIPVLSSEGKIAEQLAVAASVFGIEPNRHVLYLALRREQINAMLGTAQVKTRSEVRGGGRKPWKQKGTGRARAGSTRSPLWVGGGKSFGPRPRVRFVGMNRKERHLALRSALSAAQGRLTCVEDFSFLPAKTAASAKFLKAAFPGEADASKYVLFLVDAVEANATLKPSVSNLANVSVRTPLNLSIADLLNYKHVVMTKGAVKMIEEHLANV